MGNEVSMMLAGNATVAAGFPVALGGATTGAVGAGVVLFGAFALGSGASVAPRKNTEAIAATKTRAEPINPICIGVQKLLVCATRLLDFLLTIFLLFD
jgi:hypothetical protein